MAAARAQGLPRLRRRSGRRAFAAVSVSTAVSAAVLVAACWTTPFRALSRSRINGSTHGLGGGIASSEVAAAFAAPTAGASRHAAGLVHSPALESIGRLGLGGRVVSPITVAAKGFNSVVTEVEVEEPSGGWPTLTVMVISSQGKTAVKESLRQLALQKYPAGQLLEVIVPGASALAEDAPEELRPLLRDFTTASPISLREEFASATGDVVAIWGDDHVSHNSRLQLQVAAAAGTGVTVLRPDWFFDPAEAQFQRISKWPTGDFVEAAAPSNAGESLPEDFLQLIVCADPLTLCGTRTGLMEAAANVKASQSPTQDMKELLLHLKGPHAPQIMTSVEWAVARPLPPATVAKVAKPGAELEKLMMDAWPRGRRNRQRDALTTVIADIEREKSGPSEAFGRAFSEDFKGRLAEGDLNSLTQALQDSLSRGTSGDVAAAVVKVGNWYGLASDQSDKAARNFPVFFAAFSAVRSFIREDADLLEWESLGTVAEELVRLSMKLWGSNDDVTEALCMVLSRELYREESKFGKGSAPRTADITGTLGLTKPLEAIARATLDLPVEEASVHSLASIAWALSQAKVQNAAVQIKVAKGVLRESDKLTPPDIGKIFVAMHEREWFQDEDIVAYLTEALVKQVQQLKKSDPTLAATLAISQV
mmetsp:Transcript_14648/g.32115  ORF Transcript_14648/g.32115 Transcript_14648/m.32115 type:complete len:651 (+) Transcript_14648:74-2026(+)